MSRPPRPVYVGIDVARDQLVGHVRPLDQRFALANDPTGHRTLIKMLKSVRPHRIVLEPTGGYERGLLKALRDAALPAFLVNPHKLRAFAHSTRGLAKTDPLDAAALAHYAEIWQPPAPILRTPSAERLAEYLSWRTLLVEHRTALANRSAQLLDPSLRRRARINLAQLDAEIALAEAAMRRSVAEQRGLAQLWRRLKTAPGIGNLSAFALIARLPELGRIDGKGIASLVGVAPHPWDSGRLRGRRIIQGGRFDLRRILYMAILAAVRQPGCLRAFFLKLQANGKPPKVALMAALRKLLCRLNAMIRDQHDWQEPTTKPA
jgi:transposase